MLSCGIYVINIKVMMLARRNGMAARNIVPMPSFEIAEATFKHIPTGGVTKPTARPEIRITPNWMRETPSTPMAGKKTGVSKRIAGLTSTKVPVSKMIKSIKSNITKAGRSSPEINSATVCGTRSSARIQI